VTFLRLRHFQNAVDRAGCRETAEMWENLDRADADSLFYAACFRTFTAGVLGQAGQLDEAEVEADRAIAWLQQALAAGFRNAQQLASDEDLDALRERMDFQQLLADLADRE